MQKYGDLKKGTRTWLSVCFILIAFSFVCVFGDLVHSITTQRWFPMMHIVTDFLMLVFVLIYALFGYKKPHGNMLKYTFLIFSLYLVVCSLIPNPPEEVMESRGYLDLIVDAITGIATILAAYIGGRLDRIEKNRLLMVINGIVLLASTIIIQFIFSGFILQRTIGGFVRVFVWCTLCLAYTARYQQHKAAGLADKADMKEN